MFRSKALKPFPKEEKESKLYLWWISTRVSKHYYDFVHKYITNPIFQIKKLYQWYKNVLQFDYDFDSHGLFRIIEYKLKRLQDCLVDGHLVHDSKDLKALKLAVKLAGRLKEDKYEMLFYDRHEKKWGKLIDWTTPIRGSTNVRWHARRPKAITKKQKEQEVKDFRESCESADRMMRREERNLYAILLKYGRSWWD